MNEKETLYARWLSGELSAAEMEKLKASGEMEELEAIIKASDDLEIPPLNSEEAYLEFKQKHTKPKTKVRRINLGWVTGVAASLLLVIALYFLLPDSSKDNSNAIVAGNATKLVHDFSDGSSVLLNDGSKLNFDESNWTKLRQVQLEGEAFFQVQEGAPFVVETRNGLVEVLGTAFNVRAWGSQLYVACFEGSVRVSKADQEVILTKSQAILINAGVRQAIDSISHESPLWDNGISKFVEADIKEVFAELERQYDVKVQGISTLDRSFSGTFEHDNLDTALTKICKPLGLKYTLSGNNNLVTIDEGD